MSAHERVYFFLLFLKKTFTFSFTFSNFFISEHDVMGGSGITKNAQIRDFKKNKKKLEVEKN